MRLGRYLLLRLVTGLLGLLVFASAVWVLAAWLVPGDFTSNFPGITGEERDTIREALGLNQPLWQQYLDFMGGLFQLDLGTSYTVEFTANGFGFAGSLAVSEVVLSVLPWTVTLFALSIGLGLAIGLPLGRRVGWADHPVSPTLLAAATATSIFPPWMALVMVNVGFSLIGARTYDRLRSLDEVMWDTPPTPINVLWWIIVGVVAFGVGMVLIARHTRLGRAPWLRWIGLPLLVTALVGGWSAMGLLSRIVDLLGYVSFPLLALTLTATGEVILVVSAAMTGTTKAAYSDAAKAKGLSPGMIRTRHAGRATLLPAISRLAASLPLALGGLVIVEAAFSAVGARGIGIPGLSSALFFGGFQQRNTPLAVGAVISIGFIALIVRLALDVVHVALDPRIDNEAANA